MHKADERNKLIEILSETPFINYACKKVGLGRATFYRWRKDNAKFKKEVDNAIKEGRENFDEIAETALMRKVKEGNINAVKFYLQNNDPRYIGKRSIYVEPKPERQDKYDRCHSCGHQPMRPEKLRETMRALKNLGVIKGDVEDEKLYKPDN